MRGKLIAKLGILSAVILFVCSNGMAQSQEASGYKVIKAVPIPGDGGWDYVVVDSESRRIYVSHSTRVVVLDADTFTVVGEIRDTAGVHGIALAPELNRGFTSNGRANAITIFDLKTLATIGTTNTGKNPDAIVYDSVSRRVFTFNGGSKDATAINAADGNVVGTLALGGRPEFAAVDGKGKVYANIESTSELVELDAQALKVTQRWPLKPCEDPSGLAMDQKNRRLFVACGEKKMAVVNADSGKVVAIVPSGDGTDAAAYDPGTGLAFASNGEGTLTVIKQEGTDKYSVVENVATRKSARTMGLDLKSHNIVLPAAELIPPKEGEHWPTPKPGTFVLVVVGK